MSEKLENKHGGSVNVQPLVMPVLTLHKKWFDLILNGKKNIEYRELKQYWISRLLGKKFDRVLFRNGYGKNRPQMIVQIVNKFCRTGFQVKQYDSITPRNGEEISYDKDYIILNLGEIICTNNLKA